MSNGQISRRFGPSAVLPLKNLSGHSTQDYLADGMTEELIGRLSGIRNLRVSSRTSVPRFKDTQLSVPEIAKILGVDAIVEGSVIREGNRIRVQAQLIRALFSLDNCGIDELPTSQLKRLRQGPSGQF